MSYIHPEENQAIPAGRSVKFHFNLPFEDAKLLYCSCNRINNKDESIGKPKLLHLKVKFFSVAK